jgi:hypothetical protein
VLLQVQNYASFYAGGCTGFNYEALPLTCFGTIFKRFTMIPADRP